MAKVTSKLQVTIPRSIARACRIEPGTRVEFEAAGDAIRLRVVAAHEVDTRDDTQFRLKLFREATRRQELRNRRARRSSGKSRHGRGWRREDLYDRGLPR